MASSNAEVKRSQRQLGRSEIVFGQVLCSCIESISMSSLCSSRARHCALLFKLGARKVANHTSPQIACLVEQRETCTLRLAAFFDTFALPKLQENTQVIDR